MGRSICYDVTRLLTRVLNATPNGIDRVDSTLARRFLSQDDGPRFGLTCTGFGARLLKQEASRDAVEGIAAHWGEAGGGEDPVFDSVVARLRGAEREAPQARRQRPSTVSTDVAAGLTWVSKHGLPFRHRPQTLPKGSLYLNASQFPLWVAGSFEWLAARRDIKAAFFIHDLLPISMPEYFREAELARHQKRLINFARFGTAALVTTQTVAEDLRRHVAALGRRDLPVFVAPLPVAPVFWEPRRTDPDLSRHPFFVLCSTIEPRKNHLMILAVWRDLVRRFGDGAPKLVLVGTRGWKYDLIVDMIERSPALQTHVVAVAGLSTPKLKRLIDNARAVLMPSFGEGYGLPVHEALAAGAPVVASDIPVFREIEAAAGLTLLSPLDGEAWLAAVQRLAETPRAPTSDRSGEGGWARYFGKLDAFVAEL